MKKIAHMRQTENQGCRGLFLAGEYMRVPSVNRAVVSGIDAAKEAIAYLSENIPKPKAS